MTTLNVKVKIDSKGNASIEFDREKLLKMPLDDVMRDVAEAANRAKESAERAPAARPAQRR